MNAGDGMELELHVFLRSALYRNECSVSNPRGFVLGTHWKKAGLAVEPIWTHWKRENDLFPYRESSVDS
jgi:hypothetical protein